VITVLLFSFCGGELGRYKLGDFAGVEAAPSKAHRTTEQVQEDTAKQERKRQRIQAKQERQEQYDEYLRMIGSEWHRQQENSKSSSSSNGTSTAQATLDASTVFGSIFPTSKPRHILEGFKNALRSLIIGSTIGGTCFVGLPVAGWYQSSAMNAGGAGSGWSRLLIGALAGTISGATVTIVGAANAGYQIVTSIYTTFYALVAAWQGTRVWVWK
jgi:hypothetical protein